VGEDGGRDEGGTCLSKQAASDAYVYGCQGILSARGDGVQEQNLLWMI